MQTDNPFISCGRRYDVDWVRSLAFIILIFYHVGMYYVADWGWHVKSLQQSVLLQELMILTNPWRMSLLFVVSGMTLALIQHKYSAPQLIKVRSKRILIPLIFGMLVIVPPQLYFELRQSQLFDGTYVTFLGEYVNLNTQLAPHKPSPIGLLTWNHLWYLPYLFCYSIVLLALRPIIDIVISDRYIQRTQGWYFIAAMLLLFCAARILRADFPTTHALLDDWYNHARYFLAMLAGYTLVKLPQVWSSAIQHRRRLLITGVITYAFFIADRNGAFPLFAQWYQQYETVKLSYSLIVAANSIGWIGAAIGFAGHYLNKPSATLRYLNNAILPCYILHQTLIILLAMWLLPLALPASIESALIIMLTAMGCVFGYEIIRRITVLRFLFGLPKRVSTHLNNDYQPYGSIENQSKV
ncbi:acyltransferase family protein [Aestuariibacter salexigens]|uniref:acyltransferase family protein n=1 Tax=Aestuariibacter salexigens TaxID=226010 RepID=UPI00068693ED|nr:acyltransferase family protein [Aestuariibacter salexigens]